MLTRVSPDKRLESFLRAVKLVYASALNPDALLYRKKRGLGESDEQMAILVQRVSGMPYRKYFFPSLAVWLFREIFMPGPTASTPERNDTAGIRSGDPRSQPGRR